MQPQSDIVQWNELAWFRRPRRITVDFASKVVRFSGFRVATSFWRSGIVPEFECPFDELHAIAFFSFRRFYELKIWTHRGYIAVMTADERLGEIHTLLREIVGDRSMPMLRRWEPQLVLVVVMASAFLAAPVLWFFFVRPLGGP